MEVLEVGPRSWAINRGIPAVLSERPDKVRHDAPARLSFYSSHTASAELCKRHVRGGILASAKQQEIRHRADLWQAGSAGDRSPARAVSALTQRGISDSILTMSARPHTKVQWQATLKVQPALGLRLRSSF